MNIAVVDLQILWKFGVYHFKGFLSSLLSLPHNYMII